MTTMNIPRHLWETKPQHEHARQLMKISMPPFEQFLEHCAKLKSDCEAAGDLTPEKAALFDQYRDAMLASRDDYERAIADLICEHFKLGELAMLHNFYLGPIFKLVERAIGLGPIVANIGADWRTKVLESQPAVWQMILENVARWQRANMPEGSQVHTPAAPGESEGWEQVDAPRAAEEFIPVAPEEEAEIARMRESDATS